MRIGVFPLGRATFDVEFADQNLQAMLAALEHSGHEVVGPRGLLFDDKETFRAISQIDPGQVDQILVLQVTFTDASAVVSIGERFDLPLSIWSIPEPRSGGRLRLNSFCGLNLAAHALGLNKRAFSWIYAPPDNGIAPEITALLSGQRLAGDLVPGPTPPVTAEGQAVADAVRGRRIARIGEHPAGFDTCAYDGDAIQSLAGVEVDALKLDTLFEQAREAPADVTAQLRSVVDGQVLGLEEVNQEELDRSLRLKAGLDNIRANGRYDAFAIRCWPETFTQYGGAVCGPAALLGESRVPCACEADVYGALTQLILSQVAQAPVFLTDIVDMDKNDDTGVIWHCGQAPISMRDPEGPAEATIHTNRKQPLLYQFVLKPGPVTFLRISQACNEPKMVLGLAEMVRRPMSFTGTSGVLRFERPVGAVLKDIMACRLEHHIAIAYGDHRDVLRGTAGALNLPLLEL